MNMTIFNLESLNVNIDVDKNSCCKNDKNILIPAKNDIILKKIRDTELQKVPYMLVLGEEEVASGQLSVRKHGEGDIGKMTNESFVELVKKEIEQLLKI